MREIQDSDTRKMGKSSSSPDMSLDIKSTADPEFVAMIKRRHKETNVNAVFSAPKRDHENKTNYHWVHCADIERVQPEKTHFMKKSFYTDYAEALALQSGLMGKKK